MITRKTRNVQPFFPLKDESNSCIIYKGDCSCGSSYIGETKCNVEVRCYEHDNLTKSPEPLKYLQKNINHCFTQTIILNISKKMLRLGRSYYIFSNSFT